MNIIIPQKKLWLISLLILEILINTANADPLKVVVTTTGVSGGLAYSKGDDVIIYNDLSLEGKISNGDLVSLTKSRKNNDMIYKIKYYSQNKILTTTVIAPIKTIPSGGFPLLIWAHETVGIAERCAPSKTEVSFPTYKKNRKYITLIPDYDTNPHRYYTSIHAARAVYDGMRVLKKIKSLNINFNKAIISGYSQGGHVLLKTLEINKNYAPEFNFKQAVAFSPGSDSLAQLQNMANYYVKHNEHPFIPIVAIKFFAVAETEGNLAAYDAIFKNGQNYRYIKNLCIIDFYKEKKLYI